MVVDHREEDERLADTRAVIARKTAMAETVSRSTAEAIAITERDSAKAAGEEVGEQRQIALAYRLAARAELERSRAGGSWILAGLLAIESLRRHSDNAE